MAASTIARGSRATTRLRKIECEHCGLILRGAAGPLRREGLPEHCGVPMTWADAEDAFAELDGAALYENAAAAAELAREDRQLARRAYAVGGGARNNVGQCGGCRKPVKATNEHCPCGFANDIRGRRNQGGYRDAIPF